MSRLRGLLVLLLISCSSVPLAAQDETRRTIVVEGEAELRVVPDEVELRLGVETRDPDLETAKVANDERVSAVLEAVRRTGVPAERSKTDYLSIQPLHERRGGRQVVTEYEVRRAVIVRLGEVAQFEDLLSAALEAGVNYVNNISFRTTELRAHRDRVRELALDAAREKAEAMAARLGQRIGLPIHIAEGATSWSSPYGTWWWGSSNAMTQNVFQASPSAPSLDGPLSPGQISVTARVRVTFELVE